MKQYTWTDKVRGIEINTGDKVVVNTEYLLTQGYGKRLVKYLEGKEWVAYRPEYCNRFVVGLRHVDAHGIYRYRKVHISAVTPDNYKPLKEEDFRALWR